MNAVYRGSKMRRTSAYAVLFLTIVSGMSLFGQSDACANPSRTRIGIFTGPAAGASDSHLMKRKSEVETRFSEALIKALGTNVCVVHDPAVFSDPKNFPTLKGSMIFEIQARPSSKNDNLAAVAVELSAAQGAYMEQSVSFGLVPVLIESDADFDGGAQSVMKYWQLVGKAIAEHVQNHNN